jgi:hypothetical protein
MKGGQIKECDKLFRKIDLNEKINLDWNGAMDNEELLNRNEITCIQNTQLSNILSNIEFLLKSSKDILKQSNQENFSEFKSKIIVLIVEDSGTNTTSNQDFLKELFPVFEFHTSVINNNKDDKTDALDYSFIEDLYKEYKTSVRLCIFNSTNVEIEDIQEQILSKFKPGISLLNFDISKSNNEDESNDMYEYYKGVLYYPMYSKFNQSDSRLHLMVKSKKLSKKYYDVKQYKDLMNNFHFDKRLSTYNVNLLLSNEIVGFDHCYDCACFINIINTYYKYSKLFSNKAVTDLSQRIVQHCGEVESEIKFCGVEIKLKLKNINVTLQNLKNQTSNQKNLKTTLTKGNKNENDDFYDSFKSYTGVAEKHDQHETSIFNKQFPNTKKPHYQPKDRNTTSSGFDNKFERPPRKDFQQPFPKRTFQNKTWKNTDIYPQGENQNGKQGGNNNKVPFRTNQAMGLREPVKFDPINKETVLINFHGILNIINSRDNSDTFNNPISNKYDRSEGKYEILYKNKLTIPFLRNPTSRIAVLNTFKYLFNVMKCGIYVRIFDGKIDAFVPFCNNNFESEWGILLDQQLKDKKNVEEYYHDKEEYYKGLDKKYGINYKHEKVIESKKWWCNGNIIDNVYSDNNHGNPRVPQWGTFLLKDIYEMIEETCKTKQIKNTEFFINKRDHPQMKNNLSTPYDFISERTKYRTLNLGKYDIKDKNNQRHYIANNIKSMDVNSKKEYYRNYIRNVEFIPIFSFFVDKYFADFPFPTTDDWGNTLASFSDIPFEDKTKTLFFRGSATGGGVDLETNQRLNISQLSFDWENERNEEEVPLLDAGIVSWNTRDKKLTAESQVQYIEPHKFKFGLKDYVTMEEQALYSYILYIDGHCAAARYSSLMKTKSVIFKVESLSTTPGKDLWFFPLLKPWSHFIPIKRDFSDLKEKILWARENDEKCKIIIHNSTRFYEKMLTKEGITEYLGEVFNKV